MARDPKHLSPSSMATYAKCAKQYYYRYIEGMKIAPSVALVIGSSYHSGLEENFRQKVETRQDAPLARVLDAYSDAWERRKGEIEDWEGKKPGKHKDVGKALVKLYMVGDEDNVPLAPAVQPLMCEVPFDLTVEGMPLPLTGIIDLVREPWEDTMPPAITDHKTAGKTPSAAPDIQAMTYSTAYEALYGEPPAYEIHAALKLKEPRLAVVNIEVTPSDRLWLLDNAVAISDAIKKGAFPGNPNGWWCSPKYCGYWPICRGRM